MTKALEDLLELPAAERAAIAITRWDSVAESIDAGVLPPTLEQQAELDRRVAEYGIPNRPKRTQPTALLLTSVSVTRWCCD
jgi:putative addiction module component (TIGR02574 family)